MTMDDIAFLRQADTEILLALSNGDEGIIDFNRRFTQALEAVQNLSIDQRPNSVQIKMIIRNVRDTVAYLLGFEDKYQQKVRWVHSKTTLTIRDWVRSKAIQAIREEGAAVAATDIQANLTPTTDSQTNITPATDIEANPTSFKFFNTQILRDWFVGNLDNPFPDTKTKDDLVAETNALPGDGAGGRASKPMNTIQLQNWFGNMRRRSGWLSFKKTYARNNSVAFQGLIDALRRQGQAPPAGVMDDVAELMSAWNTKDDLTAETNALPGDGDGGRASKPMNTIQVQNWFYRTRFRSGWLSFKKTYARNNSVAFQGLIDALRRQGQAPPASVMDDVAELMSAWNVTMMVEEDEVDDDNEEGQKQQGRAKTGSKSKETPASGSSQATANPRSRVNPATADPTGTIRAKACRDAYSKMMGHIAGTDTAKER
ncbi:unnamed protein product [Tilletia controversa]|nr:unnamed protein product [Tilletia controversa]